VSKGVGKLRGPLCVFGAFIYKKEFSLKIEFELLILKTYFIIYYFNFIENLLIL
jgi:hypothetical protein